MKEKWIALISDSTIANEEKVFRDEAQATTYKEKRPDGETVIDVANWFSRVTLDVIGQTGFGFDFGALNGDSNELASAFSELSKNLC